eukprot:537479_1
MNRCILHSVLQPDEKDLNDTATKIMQGGGLDGWIKNELNQVIPKIATIYRSIIEDKKDVPLEFDFYGHRDFYSLVGYLKFSVQMDKSLRDDMVLIEAILRNFSGLNVENTESFLFPKIANTIYKEGALSNEIKECIWTKYSPLNLIRNNIQQTQNKRRPQNTLFELRNVMMITQNVVLYQLLFDSNILQTAESNVIFGSKFRDDVNSNIYLYRTIDRVRSSMLSGKVVVLLKLEQLYDSLYDVLNQRYLTVDTHKFCRICIGGESINCKVDPSFKIICVVPSDEAYHKSKQIENHTPTAFLNRFEKFYVDITLLQKTGIGNNWNE